MTLSAHSSRWASAISRPGCGLLAPPRPWPAAPRAEMLPDLLQGRWPAMRALCGTSGDGASGLKGFRSKSNFLQRTAAPPGRASTRSILGQSSDLPIRARFAPSPTGYLHLGSLRTALFNNLAVDASNGGAFILRIEDTDQSRRVEDAEERLLQDLEWAGLSWHEGPDRGGPYGPYRQSERLLVYRQHVQRLIDNGHSYRCFCSPEQLVSQKRRLHDAGMPTVYPGTCRSIDAYQSQRRAEGGEPHVVRFKGDAFGRPKFRDAIYGTYQKKDSEDDFILLKSDGFPTYHLANVVDDHLMKITHVIRGEEWLISTPKHIALYRAFGWEPPTFAHLGLLVNSDGTKLSKRSDSANVSKYQEEGVFPMALLSWLANLGSSFQASAKTPRTIGDIADALTFKFTKGGIKLNFEKLEHFQSKYRDALLSNSVPGLDCTESRILDRHLVQPMLRELEAITNGNSTHSGTLPSVWQIDLELVPALKSDETRAKYVYDIFTSRHGSSQSASSLIQQHPYLFWRVPISLYKSSLVASIPDDRVLEALGQAIEHQDCWLSRGAKVMEFICDTLKDKGVEQAVVHSVLRLVGAGAQDTVSQSSSNMFMLLGRDEWCYRFGVVKTLLEEMRQGGLVLLE